MKSLKERKRKGERERKREKGREREGGRERERVSLKRHYNLHQYKTHVVHT